MLLKFLSGVATDLDCSPVPVLTKICGRWQLPQKFLNPTQSSVAVVPVGSRNGNRSETCTDGAVVWTEIAHREPSGHICEPALSVHPGLDARSKHSVPCDIKAETNMVLSEINLDIPLSKIPLLQEYFCLNTKIVKDTDVKVSDAGVDEAMKFVEAQLLLGVDAARPSPVLAVKPLSASCSVLKR